MMYFSAFCSLRLRIALVFLAGATALLLASPALAQETDSAQPSDSVYMIVDEMPQIIPNDQEGMKALMRQMRYPEAAKEAGAEGQVFVQFVALLHGWGS